MRMANEWAEVVNLLALVAFTKRGQDAALLRHLRDHLTVLLELSKERPSFLDQMSRPEFRVVAEALRGKLEASDPEFPAWFAAEAERCFQAAGIPDMPGGWQQFLEFTERTIDRPELQKLVELLIPIALPEIRKRGDIRDSRRELVALVSTFPSDGTALGLAVTRLRAELSRVGDVGSLDELAPVARACLDALEYRID